MSHLVIGDLVFSVQEKTPLSRLSRTDHGAYSETALIDNADSEPTGSALSKITLNATWTRTRAVESLNQLRELMTKPQQVSDVEGYNLGRWTISQIEEVRSELIHSGQALKTEVTIQLLEKRGAGTSETR